MIHCGELAVQGRRVFLTNPAASTISKWSRRIQ
jgi:hypothetical protein